MNDSRTKSKLKEVFFETLNAEISMGEYQKTIPIIVVEGTLDSKIFASIRISKKVNILPIEKLIKNVVGENHNAKEQKERRRIGSAKKLVVKVTIHMRQKGFLAIGIQDEDLIPTLEKIEGGTFESSKSKFVITTFPSTDIETLLYPLLHKNGKLPGLCINESITHSRNLGIVRCGIRLYMKKERYDESNLPRIKKLEPKWDKKIPKKSKELQINYVNLTKSVSEIIKALLLQSSFTDQALRKAFERFTLQCNKMISQGQNEWSTYTRGHDFEWFVRYYNGIGTKRLEDIVVTNTNYSILEKHELFRSIDSWRIKTGLPDVLFA